MIIHNQNQTLDQDPITLDWTNPLALISDTAEKLTV